jgi:hypothetical protein
MITSETPGRETITKFSTAVMSVEGGATTLLQIYDVGSKFCVEEISLRKF